MLINDLIEKEDIKVQNMIYEIRGKQVMLDSDLAKLYECANGTKTINQAVKRHINRFPERFMFQLSEREYDNLRSQLGTAKKIISLELYLMYLQNKELLCLLLYLEPLLLKKLVS